MRDLFCYVNGQRELLPSGRGECTLLEYLRGMAIMELWESIHIYTNVRVA